MMRALLIGLSCSFIAAKAKPAKEKGILEKVLEIENNPEEQKKKKAVEEEVPPGTNIFPDCVDSKGVAVRWEESSKINDVAQAIWDKKKRPLVEYNPAKMRFLREVSRLFFYAHECGHHALGHLYGGIQGTDKEQQADCWAVHRLKQDDKLQEGDLEAIQMDLSKIARLDENHAAGVRRAGNLKWCLTDPQPKPPEPKPDTKTTDK
jgi:hypothetical protein